jgi:glycosyltransferase involved in cell wall biosynthesis
MIADKDSNNNRMKVLILHNDLRVYWKGRLKYLRQFLSTHHIDLYAIELFGKGSPYAFDPFDNEQQWLTCLFPDNSYDELSKSDIKTKLFIELDKINPDIIIGGSIVFFSGALGLRWTKLNRKKFIMFDDGKPSDIKRNFFVQYIKNLITRQIDALWLPSKDYDIEYAGLFKRETLFFHGYNTIDNKLFQFKNAKEVNHRIIITVARLVSIKNFDNLLKAWKFIEEQNDDYKLVIIGDGPELGHLNELLRELNLKRVVFAGIVANNDIPQHLYNADAFILPSLAESWGMVVNEAMAAALPVLLSNKVNAKNALLEEGVNGYGFDPLNVDEIAVKILKFINLDLAAKEAMSLKSLAIIDIMSYEKMGDELLVAINKLMTQKPHKLSFLASFVINLWDGNYNTTGWNK